jgi:hypothetical protein
MHVGHCVPWFSGGACLLNAVPHIVAGSMRHAFQTPLLVARRFGRFNAGHLARRAPE